MERRKQRGWREGNRGRSTARFFLIKIKISHGKDKRVGPLILMVAPEFC